MNHWVKPIRSLKCTQLNFVSFYNKTLLAVTGYEGDFWQPQGQWESQALVPMNTLSPLSCRFQGLWVSSSRFWAPLSLHWALDLIVFSVLDRSAWVSRWFHQEPKPLALGSVFSSPFDWNPSTQSPFIRVYWFSPFPSSQYHVGKCWWYTQGLLLASPW